MTHSSCRTHLCAAQFDGDGDGMLSEKEWRAYVKVSTTRLSSPHHTLPLLVFPSTTSITLYKRTRLGAEKRDSGSALYA